MRVSLFSSTLQVISLVSKYRLLSIWLNGRQWRFSSFQWCFANWWCSQCCKWQSKSSFSCRSSGMNKNGLIFEICCHLAGDFDIESGFITAIYCFYCFYLPYHSPYLKDPLFVYTNVHRYYGDGFLLGRFWATWYRFNSTHRL